MNPIKKAASATKKFVVDHKVAVAVVVTASAALAINRIALKEHNNFLKAEGLYDKFYELEEAV